MAKQRNVELKKFDNRKVEIKLTEVDTKIVTKKLTVKQLKEDKVTLQNQKTYLQSILDAKHAAIDAKIAEIDSQLQFAADNNILEEQEGE